MVTTATERELASSGRIERATAIRASVVAASRLAIHGLGLDDAYFRALAPERHVAIRELAGVGWLAIDVADAHYAAADALGLDAAMQRAIGAQVAERLRESYAGTILRSLRAIGALSPMTILERFPIAWPRLVQRGGVRVVELAPRRLQIECLGTSIARYRYVREGWAGMLEGTLELVSNEAHVDERPELRGDDRCGFHVSWS